MQEEMSFGELQQIVSVCLDEIVKLKQENETLRRRMTELSGAVEGIVESEKTVIDEINRLYGIVDKNRSIANRALDNIKYEIGSFQPDDSTWYFPKFHGIEETIGSIISGNRSMARFGDGEFAIMSNERRQKFQHPDSRLAARLAEVIRSDEEGMLIAIADNYGALDRYNEGSRQGIRSYMTDKVRKQHRAFLDLERTYHNAYVSRPYVLYADNDTDAPGKRFENLKRIWEKRNILIVEGALTRMGVGNDLFANAAQIRRIEAPAVNSFDKYDEILQAALQYAEKNTLFLIALGPAAGVLAYDLFHAGYQALDIGHVDLEYEWYLNGTGERCAVKHKYNNEYLGGDIVEDIHDEEYLSQIIMEVK